MGRMGGLNWRVVFFPGGLDSAFELKAILAFG